jgi:hypothetical protein
MIIFIKNPKIPLKEGERDKARLLGIMYAGFEYGVDLRKSKTFFVILFFV